MSTITLVVGGLLIIALASILITKRRRRELPGPTGLPILGNGQIFSKHAETLHLFLENWAKKYGNLYEFYALGKRVVVSGDSHFTQQILLQRPTNFKRVGSVAPVCIEFSVHGVFSAEGESWKRQRNLTTPAFTMIQIRNYYYDSIAMICGRLQRKWTNAILSSPDPKKGIEIDILPELMKFTLDIISVIAFGHDLNSLENHTEMMTHLLEFMPFIHNRLMSIVPYWKFFYLPKDRKFTNSVSTVRQLVYDMISDYYKKHNDSLDVNQRRKNFIHSMLAARSEGEDQLNDDEIIANALTILLAGQDTTANSLSWATYYLARNHKLQERVFQEVSSVRRNESESGDELWYIPDQSKVEHLKLSTSVIRETLRLRGPSPLMYYEANVDTSLDYEDKKISLQKGDTIVILGRYTTTDPRYYSDDSKVFRPDRWNSEEENSTQALPGFTTTLPFGGGPRICPGRNLSLFESNLFLATVCSQFVFRSTDGSDVGPLGFDESLAGTDDPSVKECLEFTMGPKNLRVKLFLRDQTNQQI